MNESDINVLGPNSSGNNQGQSQPLLSRNLDEISKKISLKEGQTQNDGVRGEPEDQRFQQLAGDTKKSIITKKHVLYFLISIGLIVIVMREFSIQNRLKNLEDSNSDLKIKLYELTQTINEVKISQKTLTSENQNFNKELEEHKQRFVTHVANQIQQESDEAKAREELSAKIIQNLQAEIAPLRENAIGYEETLMKQQQQSKNFAAIQNHLERELMKFAHHESGQIEKESSDVGPLLGVTSTKIFAAIALDKQERCRIDVIRFNKPFYSQPNVVASLSGFHSDIQTANRITIRPENISVDGFELAVCTWSDTKIYRYSVNWLAYENF